MPLQVPESSAAGAATMRTTIRNLAEQGVLRTPALRAAQANDIEITEPHEVFVLGLDDLRASAQLDLARPVGWRYLVQSGGSVVAAAESTTAPAGDAQVFSHVNEGPFVASTVEALAALQAEPRVQQHAFTQQLLHIPALHAMALWLHHDGADDLLVPLAPFPLDVASGQPVPAAELLGRLEELAQRTEVEPADGTKGS